LLSDFSLSVILLSVILTSVIILIVVAPNKDALIENSFNTCAPLYILTWQPLIISNFLLSDVCQSFFMADNL